MENKVTNKWYCVLAYLLFFIPIMVDSKNEDYVFHANQGLNLLILYFAVGIIGTVIPIIGWFIILPFGGLICFILMIIGMLNAFNEKKKELPVIGKIKLIK